MHNLLAKKLFSMGARLTPKHNSIFTAYDEYGSNNAMVNKAILGISNIVKSKITTYKNVILPVANELETLVKDLASVSSPTAVDKISITPLVYTNYGKLFSVVPKVDLAVTARVSELPKNPLVIEYNKDNVNNAINSLPTTVSEQVNIVTHSMSEDTLKDLHCKVFEDVSSNNTYLKDLSLDLVSNQDNICYLLAVSLGYYINGEFVTNKTVDTAKYEYLSKLINILVTMVTQIEKQYSYNLETEVLIAGIARGRDGAVDIRVIGEIYNKYLESNSIDALVGYGYTVSNSDEDSSVADRVNLKQFLSDIDKHQNSYIMLNRTEAIKKELGHIQVLKVAYRTAVIKLVNAIPEDVRDMADLDSIEDITELNRSISELVDNIGAEELVEVTEQCRLIVGKYIFKRDDFMKFMDNMKYYSNVFPVESPEYVATAVAVSMSMDLLLEQLEITRV